MTRPSFSVRVRKPTASTSSRRCLSAPLERFQEGRAPVGTTGAVEDGEPGRGSAQPYVLEEICRDPFTRRRPPFGFNFLGFG